MEHFSDAEMRRNLSLEFSIQDVRRRMVEIQWKDRLALEQEWMELYVDMPKEIEILWMNQAEGIK
ncbi:MAG: hypothetical protein VYE46_03900 [Cyanobacteriota bacterium]|nr:hypothetical protein [Cyanobacteriota bacterium]